MRVYDFADIKVYTNKTKLFIVDSAESAVGTANYQ